WLGYVDLSSAEEPHLRPQAIPFELHKLVGGIAPRVDRIPAHLRIRRLLHRSIGTFIRFDAPHRLVGGRSRELQEFFLVGHRHALYGSNRAAQRMPRRRISWNVGCFQLPRSTSGYSSISGCMS